MRRRVLDAIVVVWLVGSISFALLHLAPGDPVSAALADPRVSPAAREHWRAVTALDQPVPVQYARYVGAIVRGDWGYSFSQYRPVGDALREVLPYTLLLMSAALLLSATLGGALGAWQAVHSGSRRDRIAATLTSALASVPEVWMALMMLALFGVQLALFPVSGRCDPLTCGSGSTIDVARDTLYHAALPVLTLTLLFMPAFSRVERVAMRGVLHDDVMRTARAKGVSYSGQLSRHAFRRAALPLATVVGLALPVLVGGTVFIERIFGWPGMGSLLISAIGVRDYPLVTAIAIVGSIMVVVGNLLADMAARWLDPRTERSDA